MKAGFASLEVPYKSVSLADTMHPRFLYSVIPKMKRSSLRVPTPDTPDLIMSLPPELRNIIYDLALSYAYTAPAIQINVRTGKGGRNKWKNGLSGVSKKIRAEATSVYHGINSFVVHIKPFTVAQFQHVADWLRTIIRTCGPKPFGSFKLRVHGSVWKDPCAIMPLLQLMRETGFWPYEQADHLQYRQAIESRDRGRLRNSAPCSMFLMQSDDFVHVQQLLEQVVSLARHARIAGFGPETLRLGVEAFLKAKVEHGRGRAAVRQRRRRGKGYYRPSVVGEILAEP
ncbi:hypothetical protein LTR85_012041 [Meristemomyces frigidus]|nr:hypothetical protein LTR85_012041 [Meristemomyces frigidus]